MNNEQAIEVLNMVEAYGLADEAKKLAIKALQNERPQGEWIYKRVDPQRCGNIHGCNICGQEVESFSTDYQNRPCAFNFCPNCGANMRGYNNG